MTYIGYVSVVEFDLVGDNEPIRIGRVGPLDDEMADLLCLVNDSDVALTDIVSRVCDRVRTQYCTTYWPSPKKQTLPSDDKCQYICI